jgi:hypothetical protein
VVAEAVVKALRPYRARWDERLTELGKSGRAAIEAYRRRGRARSA